MRSVFSERRGSGFTMVELLAVIAVVGILAALVIPSFTSISIGLNVTRAGQLVSDQFTLARQLAMTKNRLVEVRFIRDAELEGYGALQIWERDAFGDQPKAIRRVESLPDVIYVNASLSPILENADSTLTGSAIFGSLGNRAYKAIRFRPNGRIDAPIEIGNAFLTLQGRRDDKAKPVNYYTLQISPLTGRITTLRP